MTTKVHHGGPCPHCKEPVEAGATRCPHCQANYKAEWNRPYWLLAVLILALGSLGVWKWRHDQDEAQRWAECITKTVRSGCR